MTSIPPFFKKKEKNEHKKAASSFLEPGGLFLPVVNNINYQRDISDDRKNH